MRIIGFGWTAEAVKARRKTVTRRAWKDSYGASFEAGELLQAWTQSPFVKAKDGREPPHRFGTIRLVEKPFKESTAVIAPCDWEAEGFGYLEEIGARVDGRTPNSFWVNWHQRPVELWVVRFEVVELFES